MGDWQLNGLKSTCWDIAEKKLLKRGLGTSAKWLVRMISGEWSPLLRVQDWDCFLWSDLCGDRTGLVITLSSKGVLNPCLGACEPGRTKVLFDKKASSSKFNCPFNEDNSLYAHYCSWSKNSSRREDQANASTTPLWNTWQAPSNIVVGICWIWFCSCFSFPIKTSPK